MCIRDSLLRPLRPAGETQQRTLLHPGTVQPKLRLRGPGAPVRVGAAPANGLCLPGSGPCLLSDVYKRQVRGLPISADILAKMEQGKYSIRLSVLKALKEIYKAGS